MEAPESCISVKRKFLWEVNEEEEENSEATQILKTLEKEKKRKLLGIAFCSMMYLEGANIIGFAGHVRSGNQHRDRSRIISWSKEIDESMFRRQFRLHRVDFYDVLLKINVELDKSVMHAV